MTDRTADDYREALRELAAFIFESPDDPDATAIAEATMSLLYALEIVRPDDPSQAVDPDEVQRMMDFMITSELDARIEG